MIDKLEYGFSGNSGLDSRALSKRILAAYRAANIQTSEDSSVLWNMIFEKNRSVHDSIMKGESIPELDDPASSNLFYGFDNMFHDFTKTLKENAEFQLLMAENLRATIIVLAEATGAKRPWNPEGGAKFPHKEKPDADSIENLLKAISSIIGVEVDFPNPFPTEFGIITSRGIASHRSIQAIYQVWRLKTLSVDHGKRIVEVGAGLGRTAYYACKMGLTEYTIIDLPFTNISQANFLGRVLPPGLVSLFGEELQGATVRILPWTAIEEVEEFDILANVDSLTEVGKETSTRYAHFFAKKGRLLWSVNHEANHETVAMLEPLKGLSIGRFPYWFRTGYVEELYLTPRRPKY